MFDLYRYALLFLEPIALITLLLFTYRIPVVGSLGDLSRQLLIGSIAALVVSHAMWNPLVYAQGTQFDVRCLLVGITVAFFGVRAGAIVLLAAVAVRFNMGGAGMFAGIVALGVGFAGAWAWRVFIKERVASFAWRTVTLGLLISTHIGAIFLLPHEVWSEMVGSLVPFYLVTNLAGVALIGALVQRDENVRSLQKELVRDPLTGLYNRRRAEQYFESVAIDGQQGRVTSIIYFDLDTFKAINDEHGHGAGDEVLRKVTSRIQAELRPTDLFCRLGGDEFAIILDKIDPTVLVQVAERCRRVVSGLKIKVDGAVIRPTISVGISRQMNARDYRTAFDAADEQLYRAKQAGRNRLAYDPAIIEMETAGKGLNVESLRGVKVVH